MGAKSSHHSQSNGNAVIKQDHSTRQSPKNSSPRHKKSKVDPPPEFNNNVASSQYVYSLTNRKQWDTVLELTLEKSLSCDMNSMAISPLTVHVQLETESRFHFKVMVNTSY